MKVDSYIEEVEKCIQTFKVQLQEQQNELQKDEGKVINLLSAFYKKDSPQQNPDCADHMTISFPNRSLVSELFKDDSTESFIFKLGQEDKRQHLAAERRDEYNSFIEKKDKELQSRRKVLEESRSVTPRSILESVDYETILAKRKEEESKFRNFNYAEPSIDKSLLKSERSVKENIDLENQMKTFAVPAVPQSVPIPVHRTGGGGDPVRDSSGKLITNRGFKASSSSSEYFPFLQDTSKHKKDYYREELRKQIEEKKRLKELEEERARLLEEQIAQRIEQQRRKMQMEYEKELQKNNLLKEQRQQERLKQLEEFQKRDADMKNKRMREIRLPDRKDSIEDLNVVQESPKRSSSPPVPSVRSKVILERVVSPEVASKTQVLSKVKPENIFSSLADIRRTIMQEQNNAKKDLKESYEVMNRRTVVDDSEDLPF